MFNFKNKNNLINDSNGDIKKSPLLIMEQELSQKKYKLLGEILTIGFFVIIIAAPIINLISSVIDNTEDIRSRLFQDELLGDLGWRSIKSSLWESFSIAFIAVLIDIIIGFPIAVILARGNFKGKKILNFLVDLPMAVPTSALGFSVMMFWSLIGFTPGRTLIIFAHVAFTYPYIVRNLKITIEKIDPLLETAARSLSAPKATVFKTISFPLLRDGLIAGSILAFTRSLGETGATTICAGLVETAPIQVVGLRKQLQLPSASFLSLILILISLSLLIFVKFLSSRSSQENRKEFWKIHYNWEKFLSKKEFTLGIKIFGFIVMILLVLTPSFYIFGEIEPSSLVEDLTGAENRGAHLWIALTNSFKIGLMVVLIDLLFGIPFAMILVREKWGKLNSFLDTILDIPLTIPSAALGFAIFMFWGPAGLDITGTGIPMIVFVHMTFTFPFVVRPIAATIKKVQKGHEEASSVFGAAPLTTFRRITLPAIKNGVIAGCIAAFTRSLGETGATIIVMGGDRTVPVLIVDWVEANVFQIAAFAAACCIILSAILLIMLRIVSPDTKGSNI